MKNVTSALKHVTRLILAFIGRALIPVRPADQSIYKMEGKSILHELRKLTPANPVIKGFQVYSQNEEDGIIEEIFRRIGLTTGTFLEIGCGNGLQNNTHYLLIKGWRGVWVDGSQDNIEFIQKYIPLQSNRLLVLGEYVTLNSANAVASQAEKYLGGHVLDFLSLDIDGNDLFVLEAMLTSFMPKAICVEYNAKFPPPAAVSIKYDAMFHWKGDDYMGASLQAYVNLLSDYLLVSCNISGSNAFFVRSDCCGAFERYPVCDIYQPPRYHLSQLFVGHAPTLKYLKQILLND